MIYFKQIRVYVFNFKDIYKNKNFLCGFYESITII